MIYDVDLQRLDVVRTSWVYAPDGLAYRFELRDGRRLDRTVSYDVLDRGGSDAVWSWIRRELERAYRRCVEHDDCAELRALGEACWASTQNKRQGSRNVRKRTIKKGHYVRVPNGVRPGKVGRVVWTGTCNCHWMALVKYDFAGIGEVLNLHRRQDLEIVTVPVTDRVEYGSSERQSVPKGEE